MYRQNDPELNPIDTWGCGYIAEHGMWERESGIILPKRKVLEIWLKNYQEKDLLADSTMQNWQGVLDDFLAFGGPKMTYLGHRDADYVPAENERELLWFERPDGYRHFVLGRYDRERKIDVVDWDPYKDSRTVKEGKIIGKRIFRVEG